MRSSSNQMTRSIRGIGFGILFAGILALVACVPKLNQNNPFDPTSSAFKSPTPTPTPVHPFLLAWGSLGGGAGQFDFPNGIDVDMTGNVYVSDWNNNRVQKFTSSGGFLTEWGSSGLADGLFAGPIGLAVDNLGNIYVADGNNHRIQKFDSNGTFLTKWGRNGGDGTSGSGDGEFQFPFDVAVDSSGNIYVAEFMNARVQKFTSSGVFITKWGANGGDGTTGTADGEFMEPRGIAVDTGGNVYVTDFILNRIQKFDSSGVFLLKWGSSGSGNGQFDGPNHLEVDGNDNVYVPDSDNDRIQKFSSSGTFLAKWGSVGSSAGEFIQPISVAIDSSGNVYVVDLGNHRIQKFGP